MRDRLIKIVKDSLVKNIDYTCKLAENITDDLLANGVIVPPCKVGDIIFLIRGARIKESKVEKIEIIKNTLSIFYDWHGMGYEISTISELGKTVFLTKEEAEQALKGGAE